MLVSDIVEYGARKHPDRIALRFEDEAVTYAELRDRSRRLAGALLGVAAPGDRVAILSTNCTEYFDCYYGVPMAGMALTILNFRLHPDQIAALIEHSGATVLIVAEEFAGAVDQIRGSIPSVHTIVSIGAAPGTVGWDEFVGAGPAQAPTVRPAPDDIAWLVYTSGTTGTPKGVMISHRNLVSGITSSALQWALPEDTVFLFCFPLCHVGGYVTLLNHLMGSTVGIVRAYDNATFLRLVEQWQVTQTGLAPTMINFLLQDRALADHDLSTLQAIGYGSSAIPAQVLRQGLERLRCDFYQGMGMTELAGNVLHLDYDAHRRAAGGESRLLAAAGKPMRLVDIRIVDDAMRDVPTGHVGEMVVRGDQVMTGYWRDPDATAAAFTDGWFHTGDLVRRDDEGFVYIVDRKKDLIISGGENVASLTVEQALYRHPAVAEAAAIGVEDDTWGELVCAVVVLRDGATATADDIITACREQLGGFQVPRRVEFVDTLPRNVTGKILKRDLRERFSHTTV
ncbi:long-chain-fatty-acid--CoA ligase [Rhodococcus koreensis]|uniref:AMP-binding enzyme C-terminal domain-containing protein n=1 Tax=Rhodococcus koreensis TaxID=99653 RepID=A0A1H5BPT7_9NOCA|nr:long-chain-fatty-acid--CoA ligase [Rhodococcus koreensis]SED56084.1 AMP-binding enzyme C-terminal domain-containing protein [Rhodococcus koreensis]